MAAIAPPDSKHLDGMTPAQRRLFELKEKLNKGKHQNYLAVVTEKQRQLEGPEAEKKRQRDEYEEKKAAREKEEAEKGGEVKDPSLAMTLVDAEAMRKKEQRKLRSQDHSKSALELAARAHEKRVDSKIVVDMEKYNEMKEKDPDFYRGVDSFAYGYAPEVPKERMDLMVADLVERAEKRAKRNTREPFNPEADVDYVSNKNAKFNRSLEKAYGKYTAEIKANFERGTAL